MPDENGYPTEEELLIVRNWDVLKQGWFGLVDYIETIWWRPDWGFKKNENARSSFDRKKALKFELHTGGWSGNESIIRELCHNYLFWSISWRMTRAGGHYYFEIPYARQREWERRNNV